MIYESVNLKGVVFEPKQNSFCLQSLTTPTGFANVGPIFYEVHSLCSEQACNQIEQKTCSQLSIDFISKELLFSEDFDQQFN